MGRVILSTAAIIFDVVMLLIVLIALLGFLVSGTPQPSAPVGSPSSAATGGSREMLGLIFIVVLGGGFALNILAVLMGARPRWATKAVSTGVVETFS